MFPYFWKLSDGYPAEVVDKHSSTVFSTFACGGGSSMGYKLAGFDVTGANDVDKEMAKLYIHNHDPLHYFLEDIRDLRKRDDLPKELYKLDVLDGSPPCSTFSMAGDREKSWSKVKKFREGQVEQTLDDLYFEFIALADKLQPKVVITENVKGLISGNAKGYVMEICSRLETAGYNPQVFLLNAATMGVPQKRQRVFIVGVRKDLNKPDLRLSFNEKPIKYKDIKSEPGELLKKDSKHYKRWVKRFPTDQSYADITNRVEGKNIGFTQSFLRDNRVPPTVTSKKYRLTRFDVPNLPGREEICSIGSFPQDYNFLGVQPNYVIGMSVPPVMMANVAHEVYKQWLS